jgi:prepilin-type N-terminal cleavage/methylation domain-containing protein
MFKSKNKGFTLIELLVVIAIIGILSSIVLASLNTARQKARDAQRVSDVKNLQLALEMYFDTISEYPDALSTLAPNYIPVVPTDPLTASFPYIYDNLTSANADCVIATGDCLNYHIGAGLEQSGHTALGSDADVTTTLIDGADADECDTGGVDTSRRCYDIMP